MSSEASDLGTVAALGPGGTQAPAGMPWCACFAAASLRSHPHRWSGRLLCWSGSSATGRAALGRRRRSPLADSANSAASGQFHVGGRRVDAHSAWDLEGSFMRHAAPQTAIVDESRSPTGASSRRGVADIADAAWATRSGASPCRAADPSRANRWLRDLPILDPYVDEPGVALTAPPETTPATATFKGRPAWSDIVRSAAPLCLRVPVRQRQAAHLPERHPASAAVLVARTRRSGDPWWSDRCSALFTLA